jgi:hypothetical protein
MGTFGRVTPDSLVDLDVFKAAAYDLDLSDISVAEIATVAEFSRSRLQAGRRCLPDAAHCLHVFVGRDPPGSMQQEHLRHACVPDVLGDYDSVAIGNLRAPGSSHRMHARVEGVDSEARASSWLEECDDEIEAFAASPPAGSFRFFLVVPAEAREYVESLVGELGAGVTLAWLRSGAR